MKRSLHILALVAIVGCFNAAAQSGNGQMPDSATMMKTWIEYSTPGPMHKMLAATTGTWIVDATMWMDPSKPPTKSTGSCENKMLLGGRYLQSLHKGEMMGMPFEGIGIMGYDNAQKVFVSSWQDNMGTGVMFLQGPYDPATKTITLKGPWEDPMMGHMEIRQVTKMIDSRHQVMEMYGTPQGGQEMKWMEMKLTKK